MVQPFPPPGGYPPYPGLPSYPAQFPYGPSFNGRYAQGLTTTPYTNSLFESVNGLQDQVYLTGGIGYNPYQPGLFPPQPSGQ
jgi:hypothetical protein